ncbi:WYL domain-containing protein [Agaribacter marinus]|uniref:WYL domain-containing protein n=1 Tax=Agaribacter marinus TaxID=1431249 RepID=A0AA37T749_9ALTE|nr:WYL domain-containing protein [Agaribacter marinus]GLR72730.1 WYL domain-containing protein [Agaribacter marinus]
MDRRFFFIEMLAYWQGEVNSSHVADYFNISRTQAKKYLSNYQALHPDCLIYDKSAKAYRTSTHFTANYISAEVSEYLSWLDIEYTLSTSKKNSSMTHTGLNIPERWVSPDVIRALVQAIRRKLRVEVDYISLANPNNEGRVIQPFIFVRTDLRWHLRAYDEKNKSFRDFVLSRFVGVPELLTSATYSIDQDRAWNTDIDLILQADSRLSKQQKAVIEREYQMNDGKLRVTSRAALAQYVLQEMQVNIKFHDAFPEAQQLVLANKKDVQHWLFNT